MSLALVIAYAQSLIGTPYKWGGNNPITGLDCSGLGMELLRASGEIDNPSLDLTAQEIYDHLVARGGSVGAYSQGTFAFYGESVTKITHVAFMVSPYQIIEAGGGGHKTLSVEDAAKNNAFVRLRDIKYRKDGLVATVKPRYASIGYFP